MSATMELISDGTEANGNLFLFVRSSNVVMAGVVRSMSAFLVVGVLVAVTIELWWSFRRRPRPVGEAATAVFDRRQRR